MVFVLLVSVIFRRPLTFLILVGREELKWHKLVHHQLISQQGPLFSPHSTAKTNVKAHSSGRMVSGGKSDVVIISVYSEKTCLKKLMMMMMMKFIIITEKPFTSK